MVYYLCIPNSTKGYYYMKKLKAAALALSLSLMISGSGCYFFPKEEELLDPPTIAPDEVTYSTYTAKRKTLESAVIVTGYVRSRTEKSCYFTDYTGRVKTVYVRAGDFVTEGDLIAEMNTGELEYLLEIQKLKVQAAKLQYNSTGSQADKLQLDIETETLNMYQAEYNGSKIYAPMSGQVSYVLGINPGTEIDPYKIIAKIVDPEDLYIEASYTGDINTFDLGDKVTVTVGGEEYKAELSYTPREAKADAAEDPNALYAEFTDNRPTFAYLGSLADIKKIKSVSENAIVIPKTLVKTDGDRTFVQVYKDGEKIEKDITTGIYNATEIEVISGLDEGDEVIIR